MNETEEGIDWNISLNSKWNLIGFDRIVNLLDLQSFLVSLVREIRFVFIFSKLVVEWELISSYF